MVNRRFDDEPSTKGPFFPIVVSTSVFDPLNSTTYYFATANAPAGTVATGRRELFPWPGRVVGVHLHIAIAGLGTGELFTASLRINNSIDYAIDTFPSNLGIQLIASTVIDTTPIEVTATNIFEVKLVAPSTGTPATGMLLWGQIKLGPPS